VKLKEIKKLDKEFAITIKALHGNKCMICNSPIKPQLHHIISKKYREYRWDESNALILCQKHHLWDAICSPHHGALIFSVWIKEYCPAQYKLALERLQKIIKGI